MLGRIFVVVCFFCINSFGFDLPNYIKDYKAKKEFNKKAYNIADSLFSSIDNEKYSNIVDYNRAIVANAKNSYSKAISLYNKILKEKKIKSDQIEFNLYRTYTDSAIKAFGSGDPDGSGIKMIKKSILGFDKLHRTSKDSVVKNNSLQELYRLSQLLNNQNKQHKQKQKSKDNKDKEGKDKKNSDKKNNKDNNKNQQQNKRQQNQKNGDKEKTKKSVDEKMYKMLLDNVKENKKKMMQKEIKAMNKNQKEAW